MRMPNKQGAVMRGLRIGTTMMCLRTVNELGDEPDASREER
jgi:hypothetical protein